MNYEDFDCYDKSTDTWIMGICNKCEYYEDYPACPVNIKLMEKIIVDGEQ